LIISHNLLTRLTKGEREEESGREGGRERRGGRERQREREGKDKRNIKMDA
jgi:hypothetical protein